MIGPENLPESHRKLSILRNAEPGFTTYYTGENAEDLAHLRSCSVLLKPGFGHLAPEGVNVVETPRPQVAFYRLSKGFEEDYLPFHSLEQKAGAWPSLPSEPTAAAPTRRMTPVKQGKLPAPPPTPTPTTPTAFGSRAAEPGDATQAFPKQVCFVLR